MESFNEDREEQTRYRQRAERIERMRREKQRQLRRRRMIKRLFPIAAGLCGMILIVWIGCALYSAGKSGKTNTGHKGPQESEEIRGEEAGIWADGESEESWNGSGEGTSQADGETDAAGGTQIPKEDTVKPDPQVYAFEENGDTVTIYSENVISSNAILVDESTDTIVASKGAKERISPASMTKVLTVLVAAEHLQEENLDDTFTMTLEITDYAYVNDCSCVGFLNEEEIPVRDLFYGTILPSGADAAVGLAVYTAGSHEAFVEMMNAKLEELGLADTAHFTNCVGLYDKEHYCTVYDMAVIMKAAMQNELCREVLSAHTYTTTPTQKHPEGILLSNWFLRRIEDKDTGGEVLGAKTGYVVQSKNCAVSYGSFAGGTSYICVTAGSTSSWRCIYDHVEIYTKYIQER